MTENVNHPKHYNSHPNGVECIDVIRHYVCDIANAIKYLWRAGLKPEMGKDDAEKEIEDLKKCLWYIEDYRRNYVVDEMSNMCHVITMTRQEWGEIERFTLPKSMTDHWIKEQTGHTVAEIIEPYEQHVAYAIGCLLHVGLICEHHELTPDDYVKWLSEATEAIRQRIIDINVKLIQKDSEDIQGMLQGRQVEGIHTAKPACRRETEPEHYDPLNIIIVNGTAFCLSDEPRKKDNGAFYSPCDICDLQDFCLEAQPLCRLHQANGQEYYHEVGGSKYRPAFGTLEIIDPKKELELELKRNKSNQL